MDIFQIRKTLEASVKKKLKANVTGAGTMFNISRERIRQIQNEIIKRKGK